MNLENLKKLEEFRNDLKEFIKQKIEKIDATSTWNVDIEDKIKNSCEDRFCELCNDEKLIFKKQIDETAFFVIDAHHGYNVFKYSNGDKDALKTFKGWFPSKDAAIEACVKLYSK